ncbi:MAG TPA: DUF1648 domain-containing protein [Thermoanaerobaculia bacterium]|nr:DUF1648 domain-containing protein [Thermoanaerobaculia bacterium]
MRSQKLPLALTLGVILAAALRVALVWERLPAVMASHFGPSGAADGWMPRGAFFVLFALVLGGTCLLMALVPALIRRLPPSLVNLPHREHWLAPQRRDETLRRIGSQLAWYALAYALFIGSILELTLRANLRNGPLPNGPFLALLALFLLATAALVIRLQRMFGRPGAGSDQPPPTG